MTMNKLQTFLELLLYLHEYDIKTVFQIIHNTSIRVYRQGVTASYNYSS